MKVAFVTNNSYRPPGLVAEKLNRLGVKAAEGEARPLSPRPRCGCSAGVAGSTGAAAGAGGGRGPRGRRVVVARGRGGGGRLDPELTYAKVRDATLAIRAGASP